MATAKSSAEESKESKSTPVGATVGEVISPATTESRQPEDERPPAVPDYPTYGREANVELPGGNKVAGPDGPAGDGGVTPRTTPDHQYQFPPNPPPSDSAQAKVEENKVVEEGLHGPKTKGPLQDETSPSSGTASKESKS